ncbi:protein unc-13 homolog D-like [Asterias rubens]|uniref:protein unc-13 homolog D-like n=1 Tax=Asterias rubens TaxID=7604 RepID=UPI001455AB82|nr:protein unc-13 homolog D-like [Asterias rubens]
MEYNNNMSTVSKGAIGQSSQIHLAGSYGGFSRGRRKSVAVAVLQEEDEERVLQETLKVAVSEMKHSKSGVSESDGNFFENFSALPKKQQSLQFRKNAGSSKENEQSDEDILNNRLDHPCKDLPHPTKKEILDLYRVLVSVVYFRLGSVDQPFPAEQELYSYLHEMFNSHVSINEHNSMVLTVSKETHPDNILLVTIIEASHLVGKDINGLSDPFCVMGILPNGDSKKPFVTAPKTPNVKCPPHHSKDKDKHQHHSAQDLQSTTIIKEQLNPKWNENFRFHLDCAKANGWFHLDVWDHDEETSVLEVVKKSGEVQGIKGVKRLLKEVIQSTRLGGSNPDDFIGCVNIKLDTIPSWGLSGMYPLVRKSHRTKACGEITLKLKMSLQRANQSYQVLSPQTVHRVLWLHIVHHEVARLDQLGAWDGELPSKAMTILQQHAVQYEISALHQSLCRWLAYSQECTMCVIDFKSFFTYGETLRQSWTPYALSADEEQYLQKSFQSFITYGINMLKRQQDMFPPTNKPAIRRLQYLLLCLAQINDMEFAERNALFQPSCQGVIIDAIKEDICNWYKKKHDEIVSQDDGTETITTLTSLTNAINTQAQRLLNFVHKTYQSVLEIQYFDIVYQELARILMDDVAKCLSSSIHSNHSLDDVEGEEYSQRSTALFMLYLALRDFVAFSEHLSERDQVNLEVKGYHKFFKRAVEKWLTVARVRAQERIKKAVELDQVALVDTMVKHSTSAVDVATCFAQIRHFWQQLDWPDTVGSYVFVAKVTDDICHGAVNYANIIHEKLRQNGYYDDEGQFDITDQLCIAINNIEQVRRSLALMPESLGWQRIQLAMEKEYGDTAGEQCQDTLQTMMGSADEDMVNVIDHVVQHVGERMRPDFRRFLRSLLNAKIQLQIDDAIDPLMEYLDTNIITLHKCLLRTNFDRILRDIWIVLVNELNSVIKDNNKIITSKPLLFCRIQETLEILAHLFHADGKGIPLATVRNATFNQLKTFVESNVADTFEVIEEFYAQKIQVVNESIERKAEAEFGTLAVKCYYNDITNRLCVLLINGSNITPKDKSGTSDPYVILRLEPSFVFPKTPSQKSSIVKATLHPLFDEKFEFPVTRDQCRHKGACLHLIMYDHDIIKSDDLEGETFVALDDIPGIKKAFSHDFSALKSVTLPLLIPEENNHSPFLLSSLKSRTTDSVAQEFAKKRSQLLKIAK